MARFEYLGEIQIKRNERFGKETMSGCSVSRIGTRQYRDSYHGRFQSNGYQLSCLMLTVSGFWMFLEHRQILAGGFKHFLFSISYMGCHPSH
jgi:hypothetical protein